MATILTNTAEWMPVVRTRLGVDAIDLPDADLNNTLLIAAAEDRLKASLPTWATYLVSKPTSVKMAAICFLAALWTDWCKQNVLTDQRESTFQAKRDKTDWDDVYVGLVNEAFRYMQQCDPNVNLSLTSISIISPGTPLYEEM